MKENLFDKGSLGLLGSLLINNVLYMFLNTFMVAYFITLTNYNYTSISIYYILSFIGILVTFLSFGKIVKNRSQVLIFRIGIILYCLYILLIALLKEKIVIYFAPLGFFYGIVQGLFWVSGHTLINEYAQNTTNQFISFKSIFSKVLKIVFPIIFGTSIELHSFVEVARVIVILSILQFICSLFIEDKKLSYRQPYNLKGYIAYIKNNKKFKMVYQLFACDGIVNYLLETLITILIVMTFKKSISLGIINTIAAICSILSVYIFQYKLNSNWKILRVSNIVLIITMILLIVDINKISIIIYNLSTAIFLVLLRNTGDTKRYEVVKEDKKVMSLYVVEHQVTCEVILNIARVFGYFVLFIVSLFNQMFLFKVLLVLVTVVILIYSKLLIGLKKS